MTRTYRFSSACALACTLALVLALPACGPPPDDDDTSVEPPDDDDDDVTDDDDTAEDTFGSYDSVSFRLLLQATPPDAERGDGDDDDSAGDDDDSSDDDDDSSGDDDDSSGDDDDSAGPLPEPTRVEVEYSVVYWSNYDAGQTLCIQVMAAEGIVQEGFSVVNACENCRGLITIDPASVTDVSDPGANPTDCNPELLAGTDDDYGTAFLTPPSEGGAGDFLTIALLDGEVWDAIGADSGGGTFNELAEELALNDLTLTHAGLMDATPESFAGRVDLGQVATGIEDGSPWLFFWILYNSAETNPNAGWELNGLYGGGALWRYIAQ